MDRTVVRICNVKNCFRIRCQQLLELRVGHGSFSIVLPETQDGSQIAEHATGQTVSFEVRRRGQKPVRTAEHLHKQSCRADRRDIFDVFRNRIRIDRRTVIDRRDVGIGIVRYAGCISLRFIRIVRIGRLCIRRFRSLAVVLSVVIGVVPCCRFRFGGDPGLLVLTGGGLLLSPRRKSRILIRVLFVVIGLLIVGVRLRVLCIDRLLEDRALSAGAKGEHDDKCQNEAQYALQNI